MCDLEVCRICLRTNTRLYSSDDYSLKKYYELISGISINERISLPLHFCYECATILHKFMRFRDKCHYSNEIYQELVWDGSISYKAIDDIVSQNNSILNHGKLTVSQIAQTYSLLHSEADVDIKENEEEEVLTDYYYYNCLSDDTFDNHETDPVPDELDTKVCLETEVDIKEDVELDNFETEATTVKAEQNNCEGDKLFATEIKIQEEIKPKRKKKRRIVSPDTKKQKFKVCDENQKAFAFLKSGYWIKHCLTEVEARKEFESKSQDERYLNAAYKCSDCYKGFSQKSMLDRHIPKSHGKKVGPVVCSFCKMRFKSKNVLNRHLRQHYIKYQCLRCNLVCNLENSAIFHEEYHSGVVRKCPHCNKEFKHMSTFYTHLRSHRSKHMCTSCGESFVSQLGLRYHTLAKHAIESKKQEAGGSKYCDVCQIKFETKDAYQKHLVHSAMHTDDRLNNKETTKKKDDVTKQTEESDDDDENDQMAEPLVKRKSRVEKTLSAVRKHKTKIKFSKKPTTCHQCGKHFDTQSACMKHHLAEHPRTSFFGPSDRIICEICGASLAPGSVAAHHNQHTRQKIFTCDTCGKSFTTSNMLRNHLVTHTGERNFACSLCDKRFTQNGSLNLHHRTFHLKQPYPKRNRRKKTDTPRVRVANGKEE